MLRGRSEAPARGGVHACAACSAGGGLETGCPPAGADAHVNARGPPWPGGGTQAEDAQPPPSLCRAIPWSAQCPQQIRPS
eukprot:12147328-Alexandrium_andersonii.AAC.1